MSHGSTDNDEPNLIPLLDLVLQLIMFFMVCANFISEQTDQTIHLPLAQQAKPMSETGSDVQFLNVDAEGRLLVLGRSKPLTTPEEVGVFLTTLRDDALARAKADARRQNLPEPTEAATKVIIRADKDAKFEQVYQIMSRCQSIGLRNLQLRAVMKGT